MAILWLVDRGSPREGIAALPAPGPENIVIFIDAGTSFPALGQMVTQRLASPVRDVRIVSHGNSGELRLSNGRVTSESASSFGFLRGRVSGRPLGASVEIHGCGVASGFLPSPRREAGIGRAMVLNYGNMQGQLDGRGMSGPQVGESCNRMLLRESRGVRFLERLADTCGVGVRGGVDYQLPDARWQLEGPTITVYPGRSRQSVLHDPSNRFGLGQLFYF